MNIEQGSENPESPRKRRSSAAMMPRAEAPAVGRLAKFEIRNLNYRNRLEPLKFAPKGQRHDSPGQSVAAVSRVSAALGKVVPRGWRPSA